MKRFFPNNEWILLLAVGFELAFFAANRFDKRVPATFQVR